MTSIVLDKDEMNALEEWLETDVNPRPPCCYGSLTCLVAESVSSKAAHSSKQWRTSSSKSINCLREESQGGIERPKWDSIQKLAQWRSSKMDT